MRIEPRITRTSAVVVLAPPSDRDQHDAVDALTLRANPPRYLVAVEFRQTDVEQHHVGRPMRSRIHCV